MSTDWEAVITFTGLDALDAMPGQLEKKLKRVLFEEAAEVFEESQTRVPVQYGVLRASGQLGAPQIAGGVASVEMQYGGAAAPYAIYVHENLTAHHAPPTTAKFLEGPLLEQAASFEASLTAAVQSLLKGN